MPKICTDEFKQSALDLINDGMPQKQVCADHISLSQVPLRPPRGGGDIENRKRYPRNHW